MTTFSGDGAAWVTTMRRRTLVACLLVIVAQAALLIVLAARGTGEPHAVPVVIQAPGVVAQGLADDANAMPGRPFDATWTDTEEKARQAVDDGTAVAAVLVDLRDTKDTALVDDRADADLNDAVLDRLASVETSYGRTTRVERLHTSDSGTASAIRLITLLSSLVGFGAIVALSLWRGPVAASVGRGTARALGLASVSVLAGLVLELTLGSEVPGSRAVLIAVAAATAFAFGLVTMAIESVAGLVGLSVAAASFFVFATPLITGTDPALLPMPWPVLTPLTVAGAAQVALGRVVVGDSAGSIPAVLVLGSFVVVALIAIVLARYLRGGTASTGHGSVRHWRARVLAVVGVLGAAMLLGIAFLPTEVVATTPLPSRASQTDCIAQGVPHSVDEINQLLDAMHDEAFVGGDVGVDAELQDGRRLFLFGDTLRSPDFDGPEFVRNSMLVWDQDCLAVVLPELNGALIPGRAGGIGYWPMSVGVEQRPGYDLVLASTQRVKAHGAGAFDFGVYGPSLAAFIVPVGEAPQLIGQEDVGPDEHDPSRPMWGAAMTVDDGWLYLYGTANPGRQGVFGYSLQVARVHPDDVLDVSEWRYWDGKTWQRDAGRATTLIPAVDGVSETLSVFHQDGRWYAFSKRNDFLGEDVLFWTAPGPTGPFTATRPVAHLPSDPDGGELTYMPVVHLGLMPEPGTIVASYSRNNTNVEKVKKDPTLYRPRFFRVRLPD